MSGADFGSEARLFSSIFTGFSLILGDFHRCSIVFPRFSLVLKAFRGFCSYRQGHGDEVPGAEGASG